MGKVKCEHCHTELDHVEILHFDREGADYWAEVPFSIHENGIYADVTFNWCGHDFDDDDDDKRDAIRCPHCHEYPFKDTEIQTYEYDRIVMFFGERAKSRCGMTNHDRIRSMTAQELAAELCGRFFRNGCYQCQRMTGGLCHEGDGKANGLVKWLGQETEKEGNDG